MSKIFEARHYTELAKIFKDMPYDFNYDGDASLILWYFRDELQKRNANYDDEKFCEAIGYDPEGKSIKRVE